MICVTGCLCLPTVENRAELYSTLAEAKMALADAKEEAADLEKEIERLKKEFELRGQLKDNGFGFRRFMVDGKPDGYAVCPRCETVDGRLIQLVRDGSVGQGRGAICPQCKHIYDSREAKAWKE